MCEAMWCCCGGGGVLHVSRLADDGGGYSVLLLHSSVVAVFRFLAGVFPQHIGERGRFCCVSAQSCWNCKIHCRRVLLWWGPKYTHVHYNSVFLLGKKLAKVFWVYFVFWWPPFFEQIKQPVNKSLALSVFLFWMSTKHYTCLNVCTMKKAPWRLKKVLKT